MPGFSESAAARIAAVVRQVEHSREAFSAAMDESLPLPYEFLRFELKDDLAPLGEADAYRLPWVATSRTAGDYTASTNSDKLIIKVVDVLGVFRGRKRDKYFSPHNAGSKGLAWKAPWRLYWEILSIQPHALMVRGLATADFDDGDSTITIDNVSVMQPAGGLIVTTDPAADLTVYNDTKFASDNNAIVKAIWNENDDRWEISDAPCPA